MGKVVFRVGVHLMADGKTNRLFQKDHLMTILLFVLLGMLFYPIFPDLYLDWTLNDNNSHGILVPFISLYLVWRKRDDIILAEARSSYWGLAVLVTGLILYVLGYGGGMVVLQRAAFVIAVIGVVLYNYGTAVFSKIMFPLAFLFFMIPIPIAIEALVSLRLQLWVSEISSILLNALSVSVLREGNILHFASTSLEVAEACSGIRSLAAFIMLGCLLGYLLSGSYSRKILLVLVAVPLAFIVNIIRVVGTGILAHRYGAAVAQGFFHEFSGIGVFLAGLVLFMVIFLALEEKPIPSDGR